MADFEFPEDITALNDDDLNDALAGAVEAFDARSASTSITPKDLDALRSLANGIESIRTEQAARHEAAQAAPPRSTPSRRRSAAAKARRRRGERRRRRHGEGDGDEATAAADAEPEPEPAPVVAAAVIQRPALDLSGVRRRQPRVLPERPHRAPPSPRPSTSPATPRATP